MATTMTNEPLADAKVGDMLYFPNRNAGRRCEKVVKRTAKKVFYGYGATNHLDNSGTYRPTFGQSVIVRIATPEQIAEDAEASRQLAIVEAERERRTTGNPHWVAAERLLNSIGGMGATDLTERLTLDQIKRIQAILDGAE